MILVEIVTALVLFQYLVFGALVARARGLYGVKAPAVTGHEMFERAYRVQMNTLELMVVLLPAMWLAARYWQPSVAAGVGAIYLMGRAVYCVAYTRRPAGRGLGFLLSMGPVVALLAGAFIGAVRAASS